MTTSVPLSVRVNGIAHELEVPAHLTLVDLLREQLGLPGTKLACDQGACGACTVLVDDEPMTSCLTFAFAVHGRSVTTIEGVAASDGTLDAVQQAFHEHGVPQCGYCTPGMVLLVKSLLDREPAASAETIERCLNANLCRCSGYQVFRRALEIAETGK